MKKLIQGQTLFRNECGTLYGYEVLGKIEKDKESYYIISCKHGEERSIGEVILIKYHEHDNEKLIFHSVIFGEEDSDVWHKTGVYMKSKIGCQVDILISKENKLNESIKNCEETIHINKKYIKQMIAERDKIKKELESINNL